MMLPIILVGLLFAMIWYPPALAGHSPGHGSDGPGQGGPCDKSLDLTGWIFNARVVGLFDTGICSNTDLDLYVSDAYDDADRLYAVIGGGDEAAFTVIDVSEPTAPEVLEQRFWQLTGPPGTVTNHVRAFRRNGQPWLALGLSRRMLRGTCGVMLVDQDFAVRGLIFGQDGNGGGSWCDVNGLFVESDAQGEGAFLHVAAQETFDLRVFDIRGLEVPIAPVEVGRYRRTDAGLDSDGDAHGQIDFDGPFDDISASSVFVADRIVSGGNGVEVWIPTVYVAYMSAGLDIFPASLVRDDASATPTPVDPADENSAGVMTIQPPDHASGAPFVVHDAVPDATGATVFLLDELSFALDDEPVQAWDPENGLESLDGLAGDVDVPSSPPHALAVGVAGELGATTLGAGSLENRLTVAWNRLGFQAWDFDGSLFHRASPPNGEPRTAEVFHQARTDARDDVYGGAWSAKIARIDDVFYGFVSDREFGLIVTCLGDDQGNLAGCPIGIQTQP